jgi:hypothetical protein
MGFHLQRDRHRRTNEAREVRNDLFGDPAGISAHASWIERDCAVKSLGERGR